MPHQEKDESTIASFSEDLQNHDGNSDNIVKVSMDISPAFIKSAKTYFRNTDITINKFHVIKLLNEAIDEIRQTETANNPHLKGSHYIWLKSLSNLTHKQQDIYRAVFDIHIADINFRKLLSWAMRSRLEPIKKFAKNVKSHYHGILQYFKSKLTTVLSKGTNSILQEIKRRSKGLRNANYFISMVYLESSNLILPSYS